MKKHASTLVYRLPCATKYTVFAHGFKRDRDRVKEFGIWKMRDKDVLFI